MDEKNIFKQVEELLQKLREANRKLKEQANKPSEKEQQDAIVLPFKKHKEQ